MPATRFREIAALLEEELKALPSGSKVPGEHDIAERFGVARATARAALQALTARNVIRRVRGVGSFTIRRIDYPIDASRSPSWSATIRAAGATPRSVVVSCTQADPPPEVVAVLGEGSCHRLVRRSYVDDAAASFGIEWVPVAVVPELAAALRANDSLHRVLIEVAAAAPRRVWVRATAETLAPDIAAQLDASSLGLGWFIESLNRDQNSPRLLCFTQRWIRADLIRVIFESHLSSQPPTA
ncbi:MAG TPA: GntR family transcriptional regulator [Pseudonocardia sp.]|nr:GntR family transcriptional regulator [Pseudonocardia sp.]